MNRFLWITMMVIGLFGCSDENTEELIDSYAKFEDGIVSVPYLSGKLTATLVWANTQWEIVVEENQGWVTDISLIHGGDSWAGEEMTEVVFTYTGNMTKETGVLCSQSVNTGKNKVYYYPRC